MVDCNVAINIYSIEGEYVGEYIIVIYGDYDFVEDGFKWLCFY